ncbi:MAG: ScpA family protein [Patescibacteria group bacterium]
MPEFMVRVGTFDGPLDLLLSLIEERKLYINEISLGSVTDSYLTHISSQEQVVPLGETAQFVLVAATLLLIKSRSLLPTLEISPEEAGAIKELEDRLRRYQLVKQGARLLERQWGTKPLRLPARARIVRIPVFTPYGIQLQALVDSLRALVTLLPTESFRETATVTPLVSLEEMIDRLKHRVLSSVRLRFSEIKSSERIEVIVQFLALLELVKGGFVVAEQQMPFDDILFETEGVSTPRYGV